MKVTFDTISKYTGLSKATVSRALSGSDAVREETRLKVKEAAEKLGYFPKLVKNLPNPFEKIVLLASRDISQPSHVKYCRAISKAMLESGYIPLLVECDRSAETENFYVQYALSHHFAGIFVFSYFGDAIQPYLHNHGNTPLVLVNNYPISGDQDVVCIDNYRSGYVATRYLIEHGHRNIRFVGWPEKSVTSRDRFNGFLDALGEAQDITDANNYLIYTDFTYRCGYEIGKRLSKDKADVTALFFADSATAEGTVDAIYRRGMSSPEDISIVATGDFSNNLVGRPVITRIGYDEESLGRAAAEIMLRRIKNTKSPSNYHEKVVLTPVLYEGTTVGNIEL